MGKKVSSKSLRKIKLKGPGGKVLIHYKKRRPTRATDPYTGEVLHGVPNLRPSQLKKLSKSERRPERPFGGVLSSKQMRAEIIKRTDIISAPLDIGQVCVKLAGREAGKFCVVVEKLNPPYVLIDGQVRRKKCNISHLEATDKKIKIKPKAATEEIKKEFNELGIEIKETKPREPKKETKPKKIEKKPKKEKKIKARKPSEKKKTKAKKK